MAFNGSGTFLRLYSWVQDAANSLFISSTRMDNEMNGMATGLSNCLTRDGQSPPSANIPMAGFKLTGLVNGTAASDSAAFGQIATAISEWFSESAVVTFVSPTTFTVAGNKTTTYTPGRRLKATVTGPPTAWYGTVLSSVFAAATTVTILKDTYPVASAALDAGLTSLQYGLDAADYISLPRKSFVYIVNGNTLNPVSNTNLQFTFGAATFDALSEFSGNSFTAKTAGFYSFIYLAYPVSATTYSSGLSSSFGYKLNGGAYTAASFVAVVNGGPTHTWPVEFGLSLAAADVVTFWEFPGQFSVAGPVATTPLGLQIERKI